MTWEKNQKRFYSNRSIIKRVMIGKKETILRDTTRLTRTLCNVAQNQAQKDSTGIK